jgi:hypothetical protein
MILISFMLRAVSNCLFVVALCAVSNSLFGLRYAQFQIVCVFGYWACAVSNTFFNFKQSLYFVLCAVSICLFVCVLRAISNSLLGLHFAQFQIVCMFSNICFFQFQTVCLFCAMSSFNLFVCLCVTCNFK